MRQVSGPAQGVGKSSRQVGVGQGKPTTTSHYDPPAPDEGDDSSWQPGRGATKKKGNPKRIPKGSRQR